MTEEVKAQPVEVVAATTVVPVKVTNPTAALPQQSGTQVQEIDPSRPAKTTFQEDLTTAGQRRVNLIWEYTQAIITVMIVLFSCIVAAWLAVLGRSNDFPVILTSGFMLVIGFYFSRTNHTAIGGIGPKPNEQESYKGR